MSEPQQQEQQLPAECCAKCKLAYAGGVRGGQPALFCRRFPPQTHFLIVPRQSLQAAGMVPSEEQRSAFPAVAPDWWCAEFSPKVELLS